MHSDIQGEANADLPLWAHETVILILVFINNYSISMQTAVNLLLHPVSFPNTIYFLKKKLLFILFRFLKKILIIYF